MSAHDSRSPQRPTMINIDSSGMSMSWKTFGAGAVAIALVVLWWGEYDAGTVKAADLVAHDAATTAHAVLHTDPVKKAEVEAMIKPIVEQARATSKTVITVQNGFFEQRADDLAYRAIDAMPERVTPRAKVRRFDSVKKRALANQKAARDIRDGIDVDLL